MSRYTRCIAEVVHVHPNVHARSNLNTTNLNHCKRTLFAIFDRALIDKQCFIQADAQTIMRNDIPSTNQLREQSQKCIQN